MLAEHHTIREELLLVVAVVLVPLVQMVIHKLLVQVMVVMGWSLK